MVSSISLNLHGYRTESNNGNSIETSWASKFITRGFVQEGKPCTVVVCSSTFAIVQRFQGDDLLEQKELKPNPMDNNRGWAMKTEIGFKKGDVLKLFEKDTNRLLAEFLVSDRNLVLRDFT